MSNYSKTTNFTAKDTLTSGDPNKLVRGSELDTEFNAISVAIATKADAGTSGSFTGTLTGCTTAPTGTVQWSSMNGVVTLILPALNATSNAVTCSISGLPIALQPAHNQFIALPANFFEDAGAASDTVAANVSATGAVSFAINGNSSGFTASGAKGIIFPITITYLLN